MYSREEAKEASLKYFKGDHLAADKWIEKYCIKNQNGELLEKTPDDMHKRLAKEFARIEQNYLNPMSEEEIYNLLKDFKYIVPQGSPMYGIGNTHSTTSLSNCFVIGSNNADSYGSIMRADEEQVQLMKRRGGVGQDISHLRSSGALANNSILGGLAGSTLYMERYSNSTREVAQDGRRGALMLSMGIRHPDIERFIDAKLTAGKVTGANISVKITDDFMDDLEKGKLFWQSFPIDLKIPLGKEFDKKVQEINQDNLIKINGGYLKEVQPKKIWDKIIFNAWKSAEPGVLFWDTITRESPADCYGSEWKSVSTNPCFTGDTIIAVADGRNGVTIKELSEIGNKFIVYSARKNKSNGNHGKGWKAEIKEAIAFKTGNKKIIEVTLSDGSSFKCTPEHLLATQDGRYIEAIDSIGLELAKFYSFSNKNSGQHYRHINSKSNGKSKQYRIIWEYYFGEYDGDLFNIDHENNDSTDDFIKNLRKLSINEHKDVTKRIGADNPIQKILGTELHRLSNKRKNILANASKYNWDENRKSEALSSFDKLYGHIIESLKPQDLNVYFDESVYVENIVELGFEDVYDLNVEDNHNFYIITNSDDDKYLNCSGILVHNCGEIPLCPYDSCRLIAINLYSYVINPFTSKAKFNFKLFKEHVVKAQRLMDDLVDLEIEKIELILNKIISDPEPDDIKRVEYSVWEKIRNKAIEGRRTGLGITAEGDMLAALGLRYGTEEATKFAVEVHRVMAVESYRSSVIMAKERGSFMICDVMTEIWNPFISRVMAEMYSDEDYQIYLKHGRRNISNLTIAPTGTTSLMTQTTSGIEPLFQAFYKRRTKTEDQSKITYIDEMGDGWQEYFVLHPKFKEWYKVMVDSIEFKLDYLKNIEDLNEKELQELFEKSPYYKATANDIDWKASVEMQGAVQKWVDHSISKTVNVPAETTIETVDEIYRTAYKSGCKGVTIYRDRCRQGVLLTGKEDKKDTFEYKSAYKRPQKLECDIYHKVALKMDWIVIVGKVEGKPYEIFGIRDVENIVFPTKIEKGHITKVKSRTYELEGILGGKTYKIPNIISLMTADQSMDTRKYSSMLRHGMHPQYIVEQIDEYATVGSFDKVIQRVLKNYTEEKEKKEKCPECGSDNYHAEAGCFSCPDCGYSKCSG